MNVQDLCDILVQLREAELATALGTEFRAPPDLSEALTPEFLADNFKEFFAALRGQTTQDKIIGMQEINAFLCAFQRAYEVQARGRTQRWADIFNHTQDLISETGPLQAQLRNIGVKVDPEFKTRILFRTEWT